jgi:dienelactone hydrolase
MPLKKKHLSLVRTHAATGVPFAVSPGRYPVLIFCPSWTGGRFQNTFQAEDLASHGFVVVGIDHPYSTHRTVFPDGRVITSVLGEWLDFSSDSNFQASLRFVNDQLRVRTADARFVLDTLERWDRCDPDGFLTDRLDIARVGIWGHSFGGAVAAEACRVDTRFRAAIDLDGCLFGESAAGGVQRPFLVMSSEEPLPTASELENLTGPKHRYFAFLRRDDQNIRQALATNGGYFLTIRGASHMNYCDSPLFSPIKRVTGAGPIDVRRAMSITNAYTLAFFNQYVRDQPETLMDAASPPYADARLQKWPRPSGNY